MRVLVAIPHFFDPAGGGAYGSQGPNAQPRIWGLTQCLRGLHGLFAGPQELWARQGDRLHSTTANQNSRLDLDIVVCTTGAYHLLGELPVPAGLYRHHPTQCAPLQLGFECHAVLQAHLGEYDCYCYLEDDLILHDPAFFAKLAWFNTLTGDGCVLQPNRFEMAYTDRQVKKVYIDFELEAVADERPIVGQVLGQPIALAHTSNPHAGAFFLNQRQMAEWAGRDYFLDRDSRYVGPLESAASLGLAKTFTVYKPAAQNANFLEIQHYGQAWSQRLYQVRFAPRPNG